MSAPTGGPLVREICEIAEGKRQMPRTTARRHHYVPAFLLANFARERGARRGFMYQLDIRSGKPGKTTPNDACFQRDLYAQHAEDGGRDNTIEALFAIVEKHSAPAIRRLLDDPLRLSSADRITLSYYLAFQYGRSPVVLSHLSNMAETSSTIMFASHMEDAGEFQSRYREIISTEADDDEIERLRLYMRERLASGAVRSSDPRLLAFQLMLGTADALAETIADMQWLLTEAEDDEFVISDRALAMHDPTPPYPWSGHALMSSPNAQTTIPLSPEHVLVLEPGAPRVGKTAADRDGVRRINLRTYGWADRFIYARNQAVVQRVRQQAKSSRSDVIRPKPMRQVLIEVADPDDPNVGAEHARRGWPRGFWIDRDGGGREYVTYTVLDSTTLDRQEAARIGASTGRRVIERAIADGLASPDRLGPG